MNPAMGSGQAELLDRAKGGDREAFERLLVPHLPMLLAYCRTILGDAHLAEDAVQESSLIAFRKLNHFFPEADFATWLKAIARLEALSARRLSHRGSKLVAEALIEEAYEDPAPPELGREEQALARCLERLQDRARHVVRSYYFEGSKLTRIAEALRMNLNTVKWVLYRARLGLLECVARHLKGSVAE